MPGARLIEGDMTSFELGRRFDVIVCVFDSVNHLLDVGSWAALFACVHAHLTTGGLFVLDVNTVGELHRLGEEPPWVYDFDGGTAVIDVSFALDPDGLGVTDWDIRIFERITGTRFELHHERIGELGLPLDRVRTLLSPMVRAARRGRRGRTARPPMRRSRPTTPSAGSRLIGLRRPGQSRSRRPEALVTGRATANRIISSLPMMVTSGLARVTAV